MEASTYPRIAGGGGKSAVLPTASRGEDSGQRTPLAVVMVAS
ncbi:hypothetical protein ACWFQ8_30365 [Streptomyces sp. NPDC055254]